jgi:hypothetical protein
MPGVAHVFRDPARQGTHTHITVADDERYVLKRYSDLAPNPSFAHAISSVDLLRKGADAEETSLYLFTGSSSIPASDNRRMIPYCLLNGRAEVPFVQDFHGDFLRLTLPAGPGGTMVVNDLTTHAFNDKAMSMMLVNRWRHGRQEQTISARNTFTAGWNFAFMGLIPIVQLLLGGGVAISRIQDPVFSWLPFPPPSQSLATNYAYMAVSQWFVFHASGFGMNAWLLFYLRLGRDTAGQLELNVVDMDRYVWPGTGQGELYTALDGAKGGIISALQDVGTLIIGTLSHTPCSDVYLLPGTQPNVRATAQASAHGNALEDVTIVLEK